MSKSDEHGCGNVILWAIGIVVCAAIILGCAFSIVLAIVKFFKFLWNF